MPTDTTRADQIVVITGVVRRRRRLARSDDGRVREARDPRGARCERRHACAPLEASKDPLPRRQRRAPASGARRRRPRPHHRSPRRTPTQTPARVMVSGRVRRGHHGNIHTRRESGIDGILIASRVSSRHRRCLGRQPCMNSRSKNRGAMNNSNTRVSAHLRGDVHPTMALSPNEFGARSPESLLDHQCDTRRRRSVSR